MTNFTVKTTFCREIFSSGQCHGNYCRENTVNKSCISFAVKTPCNHRTPLQAVSLASSLTPLAELILCSIVDPNCILPNPLLGYLLNRDTCITVYISEEVVLNWVS